MIDFDISVSSAVLSADGNPEPWDGRRGIPTIDITLSNFTGGQGNGYSVRHHIVPYVRAQLDIAGSTRPHPARVAIVELSDSFVQGNEQYGIQLALSYPHIPEGGVGRMQFGWRQQAFLEVTDGRGNFRQMWLPGGTNGDFDRGDQVPSRGYQLKFDAVPYAGP